MRSHCECHFKPDRIADTLEIEARGDTVCLFLIEGKGVADQEANTLLVALSLWP